MEGDPRQEANLTEEEVRLRIVQRKLAEAAAEQANEREILKTVGMAGIGLAGLVVAVVGLLWQENVIIGIVGFVAAAIAFGVVTAREATKLVGRNGQ